MDPSERYTPCIEIVSLEYYVGIHISRLFSALNINNGYFLLYKSKPGNPIFVSLSLDARIRLIIKRILDFAPSFGDGAYVKYNKSNILQKNFILGQIGSILKLVEETVTRWVTVNVLFNRIDTYNLMNKYKYKSKDLFTLVNDDLLKCVIFKFNLSPAEKNKVEIMLNGSKMKLN